MIVRLSMLLNLVPEAIAALVIVNEIETVELPLRCLFLLAYSVLLRVSWTSSILIHGFGHTLAIAIVDRQLSVLNLTNILEHKSLAATLQSLLPFNAVSIPFARQSPLWIAAANSTRKRILIKALGGVVFNLLAVALVCCWFPKLLISQSFVAANLLIVLCSLLDIVALVTGVADCFYCGNFGFIIKRNSDDSNQLLTARMSEIARQMRRETEIRGEQVGGGLILARLGDRAVFIDEKIDNRKRDDLTKSLEAAFASVRRKASLSGIKPLESSVTGAWHYCYAISGSPPTERETHWYEWMGARNADVWQFTDGNWKCQWKNVNHRITHNGVFDAWTAFGKDKQSPLGLPVAQGRNSLYTSFAASGVSEAPLKEARRKGTCEIDSATLGLWLERVLHTPNATHGDSSNIAGMMDLLITQGMWFASVRLAYQLTIASSIKSAFGGEVPTPNAPNTAPSIKELNRWADIFSVIFSLYQPICLKLRSSSFPKYLSRLEENILQEIASCQSMAAWSEPSRVAFVKTAINAFFFNDLYRATKVFMSRAKGSFGLVTVSTLEEEQLVLSAKGQPITIGFNWQQGYMVYASEPAAVDRVLLDVPSSSHLDLNQEGEVARVSADNIVVYSLKRERELKPAELDNRWLSLKYHIPT